MAGAVDNHEDRVMKAAAMYDGEASAEDYGDRVKDVMGGGGSGGRGGRGLNEDDDDGDNDGDGNSDDEQRWQQRRQMAATTMTRRQQQRARPWKGRHNVDAAGEGGNER
jgi:hypothetical protein